jgi:hypothetical protein
VVGWMVLHFQTSLKHVGRSPRWEAEGRPKVSPLDDLKYYGSQIVVCCSDLMGGHGNMR